MYTTTYGSAGIEVKAGLEGMNNINQLHTSALNQRRIKHVRCRIIIFWLAAVATIRKACLERIHECPRMAFFGVFRSADVLGFRPHSVYARKELLGNFLVVRSPALA
jgi:hypothetical protein